MRQTSKEAQMLAATFGVGQVAYSLLWFFLFLIEIWLMVIVFTDIFRSRDLRGWTKALWVVLVLLFPLVGILAYLIIRGDKMRAHEIQAAQQQERAFRMYVQSVVGSGRSVAEELAMLTTLRDHGDITTEEYRRLKAQVLGSEPVAA